MRDRFERFDWAATPLGPRDAWSPSLSWSVDLIFASGFPMAVRWGPDLIQLYNGAYAALLEDKHPAAFGRPTREVWPEIFDQLGALNHAILRGERPAFYADDYLWRIRRRGVTEDARFTISYSPIPDATAPHGIGGVLVTAVETTGRVRDEHTLRVLTGQLEAEIAHRSRERDRIWAMSEDLLGVANFEGYFTSVNPAWTRTLGWSEDELKRLHVSDLRHPDDAAVAIAGRARLAQGVPSVRMENRFRHRDGSWRWIYWTMTVDEGVIYVAGRDVTEDKKTIAALGQSEMQLAAFVDGVVDYAFIMLDPNGIVSTWNVGAERIKGYAASEIIGRHFSAFYTPEDRASGLPERSLAIAASTGKFGAEAWRVRKDGTRFFANVIIDTIYDDTGKLIGFAKITRDITERREAQAALDLAQAQLAQSQKMEALGQLTGGVAHDFNNLLMIVSGQAQSLLRRLTEPKIVRSLQAIETAAARGGALTRQLLTFARRQPLNPRTIGMDSCITGFADVLRSSVPGNIHLQFEVRPDVWPVAIDAAEFELALVNLIVNARDAMPLGGDIVISAENVALTGRETIQRLTGDFVAVTVADTGTGIPPDLLTKVFEPFFTTKPSTKGTGLGLSQVYGFAQQSGGGAAIESMVGSGTRVTIYIPRSHNLPARADAGEPAQSPGNNERILVVEDNSDVRNVAVALLEQLNYRTHAVETACEALDVLASGEDIDLVFTDIMLPGDMDGLELAAAIRRKHAGVPVLLTSGYAKALSATHREPILRKPYRISMLSHMVRDALTQSAPSAQSAVTK